MGVMEILPGHSRLVCTPHPVVLDGQTNLAAKIEDGETLGSFLRRNVPDWTRDAWEVRINGVLVPVAVMERVRPKDGTLIEVRGVVRKQALYIVAMVALTYFTFGIGTAAGWGAGAAAGAFGGGIAGAIFASAVFVAGSMLINKVLAPKAESSSKQEADSVYSIGSARNQPRQYQPLSLNFGTVRVTPDVLTNAYTWYEGNDQYVGLVLTPGINVSSVEALYLGDALLSSYEGVATWFSGFSGMPEQTIPLYSNVDAVDGGELSNTTAWVTRTTSADTVRIQVNLQYILGGVGTSGKPYQVGETVEVQYCPAGTSRWTSLMTRTFQSKDLATTRRATLAQDVARGQYDVRARILGQGNYSGSNTQRNDFQWTTLSSVQADDTLYPGIPRIGIRMKATGQLNGAPDEIRCVVHTKATDVWTGSAWVQQETSNPGAQILRLARGLTDPSGKRIAGIGLSDEMIDVPALQAFTLHCAANGYTYNYCIKDPRSHDEMLNALALAGMGQVTWAGGKLSVVWAADEQPLGGVVNMSTIRKGQFQVDYTLAEAADGVEYSYYDSTTWETKTLRVAAPGVVTMLNPAKLTGEGITSEAHAAEMARYHLAQSLYQYKDISYSTDLEHLSYRRLTPLALQHDMTQWGYGGRVQAAVNVGGIVTLTLDEAVPAPPADNAFIGLRIPGEQVYRLFGVRLFGGRSNTLTLKEVWPNDAALPGDDAFNPAHDTIWIYDFKQTPGYRVRVVGIQPESDLRGASVSVVAEPPEFWVYVKTGQYIPPPNQSLLTTRPIASNLKISESKVVQGDTVYTELVATFDITGPVGRTIVMSDLDGNSELELVADTITRTARWRIPGAGTYPILVRPMNPDGFPGASVSGTYTTTGAGSAPINVDTLTIDELSGGIRRYSWAFNAKTIRSPDYTGVQIRYIAGSVANPNWSAMTPLGDNDGYHASAFESTLPEAGSWTFAIRAMNTSGNLSNTMLTVQKALTNNLGQELVQVVQKLTINEQRLVETIEQVDEQAESIIQQEINIAQINGREVQNRAYISALQETSVTEEGAAALVQEQVAAATGDLRATVQQTSEAVTNINGTLSAYYNVKVQTTIDGRPYLAGIGVGVDGSGGVAQSEIVMLADRLVLLNQTVNGQYFYPFEIVGGVAYFNAAMIRDGTITNAKIGEEIKSLNYQWDGANGIYRGWRIGKDGTAQFGGDVEVRGDVSARSITGSFETSTAVSWTGSISNGGISPVFTLDPPLNATQSHRPELVLALQLKTGDGQDATSCTVTLQRQNPNNPAEWWNITSREYAIFKFTNASMAFMYLDDWTAVANNFRFVIQQINGQTISLTNINGRIRGAR
ncbi:host specificity factor TipJ family phage tail protein [Xanthomonas axonopodis pv. phyllanthi]|uniref:host specificity factor TipJ family phage tail protein n=1 Tax=Xanthomonas axonopodis TaxID=53413 RepID=UPI0035573ECE